MTQRNSVKTRSKEDDSQINEESSSELRPFEDMAEYLKQYTRESPEVVALTCLGIGFILGWKLKPW